MVMLRRDTVTNLILWNQYFQVKKETQGLALNADYDIKNPVFLLLMLLLVGFEHWIHIFVREFFQIFKHESGVSGASKIYYALNSTFEGGGGQSPQDNLKILFEFIGVNPIARRNLIHRVRGLMDLRNRLVHGHDVAEEMIVGDEGHMDITQSHLAQRLTWANLATVEGEVVGLIDDILRSLGEVPSIPDNWGRRFSEERRDVSKYFKTAPDTPLGVEN